MRGWRGVGAGREGDFRVFGSCLRCGAPAAGWGTERRMGEGVNDAVVSGGVYAYAGYRPVGVREGTRRECGARAARAERGAWEGGQPAWRRIEACARTHFEKRRKKCASHLARGVVEAFELFALSLGRHSG